VTACPLPVNSSANELSHRRQWSRLSPGKLDTIFKCSDGCLCLVLVGFNVYRSLNSTVVCIVSYKAINCPSRNIRLCLAHKLRTWKFSFELCPMYSSHVAITNSAMLLHTWINTNLASLSHLAASQTSQRTSSTFQICITISSQQIDLLRFPVTRLQTSNQHDVLTRHQICFDHNQSRTGSRLFYLVTTLF
jgi:hypothetical protein